MICVIKASFEIYFILERLYLIEPLYFVSPQTQCTRACLALTLGTHDWEAWKISWPFLSQNQLFSSNLLHHAKILSFFLWWKVERKKKINSHGMEQAKTMSIVHTWMLTKINNQSWLTNTLLCNHLKLVLLLGGYLSISRSNLFTNSWLLLVHFKQFGQLCNIKLYTHFHSSLDKFPKSAFFDRELHSTSGLRNSFLS